jgi:hypothetical protein
MMEAWQKRVGEEQEALSGKLAALSSFIGGDVFKRISGYDQGLLRKQLMVMREYNEILMQRIMRFGVAVVLGVLLVSAPAFAKTRHHHHPHPSVEEQLNAHSLGLARQQFYLHETWLREEGR